MSEEAKTELETAKKWAVNGLSIEKVREYVKIFNCDDMRPFTDKEFLHIFRKEVIEPFAKNLPNYEKQRLMNGSVESNYQYAFELYKKEVLHKQPETSQPDLIGKLKEARANISITCFTNDYGTTLSNTDFVLSQIDEIIESLTTLADKQDLK